MRVNQRKWTLTDVAPHDKRLIPPRLTRGCLLDGKKKHLAVSNKNNIDLVYNEQVSNRYNFSCRKKVLKF